MRKIIVVYNPRSSQYEAVAKEVLEEARKLRGCMVGKYEVVRAAVNENAEKLAKILEEGDLVVVAGGDGTATMAVNAAAQARKTVTLAVLGYGYFNDMARALGTLKQKLQDVVAATEAEDGWAGLKVREVYPLEVKVDGKHWRYVMNYVTMGMAAEAVGLFEEEAVRKKMKRIPHAVSYLKLAGWYYRRRGKKFLSDLVKLITDKGEEDLKRGTDILVMNGPRIAKVMKGRQEWLWSPEKFGARGFRLRWSLPLFGFMVRSLFKRVPVCEIEKLTVDFANRSDVMIQAEGEQEMVNARRVEIRKTVKPLRVVCKDFPESRRS